MQITYRPNTVLLGAVLLRQNPSQLPKAQDYIAAPELVVAWSATSRVLLK